MSADLAPQPEPIAPSAMQQPVSVSEAIYAATIEIARESGTALARQAALEGAYGALAFILDQCGPAQVDHDLQGICDILRGRARRAQIATTPTHLF